MEVMPALDMNRLICVTLVESEEIDLQAILDCARTRLPTFKLTQYTSIQSSALPHIIAGKLLKANPRGTVDWHASLH